MKTHLIGLIILGFCCLGVHSSKRVFIYGIDGWNNQCTDICNPGALSNMKQQGSYTETARAYWPAQKSVNWASILMGTTPSFHGIISDDNTLYDGCSGPPTIFDAVKSKGGMTFHRTVFSTNDIIVKTLLYKNNNIDDMKEYGLDTSVTDIVRDISIPNENTLFLWHFPQLLYHAVNEPVCSKNYCRDMNEIFDTIQLIHQSVLSKTGNMVTSIVTSTLGIHENEYNMDMNGDNIRIPMIIYGHGIRTDYRTVEQYMVNDISALALQCLDIQVPADWHYKSMNELKGSTPNNKLKQDPGDCRYNYNFKLYSFNSFYVALLLGSLLIILIISNIIYCIIKRMDKKKQTKLFSYLQVTNPTTI